MQVIKAQQYGNKKAMYRYTTPLHQFVFEEDPEFYSAINICYFQGDTLVLEKNKSDLSFDGRTTSYRLTQAETALFKAGIPVDIEIRVKTLGGEVPPPAHFELSVTSVLREVAL